MKWGVRRYQNKDGSLTTEGKKRYTGARVYRYVDRTTKDVQDIADSLSDKERRLLGGTPGTDYLKPNEIETVAKRFIKRVDNVPVAFLDIYYQGDRRGEMVIGTRNEAKYRRKGYASELVVKAKEWLETPQAKEVMDIDVLEWNAYRENQASINLAERHGFEKFSEGRTWWSGEYRRKEN